jgi:putative ATPase
MTSLFTPEAPLAYRIRPRRIEEFVGQPQLMAPGAPLRRLIEADCIPSLMLYGPPGTGKTSLARLISTVTKSHFERISAVESGVAAVREVLAAAAKRQQLAQRTLLFLDEIHRFSKAQQDALLPGVEQGTITLVGATTVNPGFGVIAPLMSRCQLFRLEPLDETALGALLDRAFAGAEGLPGRSLSPPAREQLVRIAAGDGRRLLGMLEIAASLQPEPPEIGLETVAAAAERAVATLDRNADAHYDFASAFIKSIRGSDPDAAIYYMTRMLEGGEDPRFITRRLMISAAEDIGLADPQALSVAVAAAQAFEMLGQPEGEIPLAEAAIYLALAPKSNSAYLALGAARAAIAEGALDAPPPHLRDATGISKTRLGHGKGYLYPHDHPEGWVEQQYLPDALKEKKYFEGKAIGREAELLVDFRKRRGGA